MKPWRSTFITNGVIVGAGLVGGVFAARFLGAEDRGLLAAIIYWPHFIAGIAAMGLNEGIVIYTARSGTSDTLRATTFTFSISLAFFVGVIGYFLIPYVIGESRQDYLLFTQIYLLVFLPVTYLAQNFLAIDQGEFNFRRFNCQRIIQAITYPILLLFLWLTGNLSVEFAAIAVLSGTAFVAILRGWDSRRGILKRPSIQETIHLLTVSIRLYIVNIIMALSVQVDKMVLVLFSSNTELGLYVVATTAAGAIVSLFVQTYINIMLPTAAQIGPELNNIQEIILPLRQLITVIILITLLLFFIIPYLVLLVFGFEFKTAGQYAQVLLLAFAFIGVKKVFVYLLRSWNENRPAILSEGVTAIIIIIGAYVTIKWWGTMGLCVLVVAAHALGAAAVIFCFFKITGLTARQLVSSVPNSNRK